MHFQHDINKLARISFNMRPRFNGMTNMPVLDEEGNPTYEEDWQELNSVACRALEELQNRIDAIEASLRADVNLLKRTKRDIPDVEIPKGPPPSKVKGKGKRTKPYTGTRVPTDPDLV